MHKIGALFGFCDYAPERLAHERMVMLDLSLSTKYTTYWDQGGENSSFNMQSQESTICSEYHLVLTGVLQSFRSQYAYLHNHGVVDHRSKRGLRDRRFME